MTGPLGNLGESFVKFSCLYEYVSILREMGTAPAMVPFQRGLSRLGDPVFRQQTPKRFDASPAPQMAAWIEAILFDNLRQVL